MALGGNFQLFKSLYFYSKGSWGGGESFDDLDDFFFYKIINRKKVND